MAAKTQQLQIRVTPRQKAALKRQADAAGRDVSSYVLSRLVPPEQDRFATILRALESDADLRFALAELNDFARSTATWTSPPSRFSSRSPPICWP